MYGLLTQPQDGHDKMYSSSYSYLSFCVWMVYACGLLCFLVGWAACVVAMQVVFHCIVTPVGLSASASEGSHSGRLRESFEVVWTLPSACDERERRTVGHLAGEFGLSARPHDFLFSQGDLGEVENILDDHEDVKAAAAALLELLGEDMEQTTFSFEEKNRRRGIAIGAL